MGYLFEVSSRLHVNIFEISNAVFSLRRPKSTKTKKRSFQIKDWLIRVFKNIFVKEKIKSLNSFTLTQLRVTKNGYLHARMNDWLNYIFRMFCNICMCKNNWKTPFCNLCKINKKLILILSECNELLRPGLTGGTETDVGLHYTGLSINYLTLQW